jgi:peptide/nickel transport system permease protein
MLAYTVRRLLAAIPILLAASFIVYILVAISGDPLEPLRLRNPPVPEETIRLREQMLYLDRSIFERYWLWLTGIGGNGDVGLLQGKFGPSVFPSRDIGEELLSRSWVTFRLVFAAMILAVLLAIVAGVLSAVKQYSRIDYTFTFFGFLALSIPLFWFAILLKNAGVKINEIMGSQVFFTIGEASPDTRGFTTWERITDIAGHMILPTLSLMLLNYAAWSRYLRGSMLEVLNSDYVRLARAKGLRQRQVMTRHALRTALIPLTTQTAIDIGGIIGGAVITETVFQWRGLGRLLLESVTQRDVFAVTGWLLLAGSFVIIFNLIADLLYAVLDPRIRYE